MGDWRVHGKPACYQIVVKVIDIFGNDTTDGPMLAINERLVYRPPVVSSTVRKAL